MFGLWLVLDCVCDVMGLVWVLYVVIFVLCCLDSFEPVLWCCGLVFSFRFWGVGLFRLRVVRCDLLLVYFGGYLGAGWAVCWVLVVGGLDDWFVVVFWLSGCRLDGCLLVVHMCCLGFRFRVWWV